MDLSDKGSECEEINGGSGSVAPESDSSIIKTCVDCGTAKTPLWRGGPAGPKSLCNACGIKSRKKRRALMGVTKEVKKSMMKRSGDGLCGELKEKVALQRPRSNTKRRRKFGEEEQAAFLLMALSCGSVYSFA